MSARPRTLSCITHFRCRKPDRFHPAVRARLAARWVLLLLSALACWPGSLHAQNVTTTIPVQIEPYSVAINPVTNQIYVASAVSGLTVINGATGATTFLSDPNATGPNAVAVNPVTNLVYVANNGSGNVSIFYGATASTAASYDTTVTDPSASGPWALAIDPVDNQVFVANDASSNVTVIAGSNYYATVATGAHPDSLAVNPITHLVYVANRNAAGTLTVINPTVNPITSSTIAVGSSPSAVGVMTASNLIFVACFSDSDVWELNGYSISATPTIIQDSSASGPDSIATNPVTNQVYVANLASANATVITLGSPNVVKDISLNSGGSAIAVDVVTNIAYSADTVTGTIGVINGNSLTATNLASGGSSPQEVAVNPVTHRAYVANYNNPGSITVIDGATSVTGDVQTGVALTNSIAVDPITNLIFVADKTNNDVVVVNGATNAVTQTVAVGVAPGAMVVDSARGFVYGVLGNDPNNIAYMLSESDFSFGGLGDTSAVTPIALDFNTVTNTVFIASQGSSTLSWYHVLYQEETTYSGSNTCSGPNSVAANPVTNDVWVTCNDGNISLITYTSFNTNTFGLSAVPVGVALNPVTNQIYAATTTGDIDIIDGASLNITTVNNGNLASNQIAVNTASGKVYVLNSASTSVTVLDPNNNNALTRVSVGNNPSGLAVNPVTNKIYVSNAGDGTMTVIDGPTNSTYLVTTAAPVPAPVAVNPTTNTAYVADTFSGDLTSITEFQPQGTSGLTVAITPLVGVGTNTLNQDFNFTVTNSGIAPADQVLYQVDTWQGQWQQATLDSSNKFDGMTTLTPGYHILFAYATAGEEATEASGGLQSSPVIGAIASYGFLVAPALAQFSHEYFNTNFGTQGVGTQSAPQTITLANDGGAPLNISNITMLGNNPSDFVIEVGAAQNDCNNLGGVLPGGTQCNMLVYFEPQTTLDESAVLTVTDDSGGVTGSQQTQPITGNGVPQVTITASGAGSGSVNDGYVSLYTCSTFPCTASYLGGQQITFAANPNNGSVFNGFTGDCDGTAPCTLTMSQNHTFNVDFEPAAATTYTLTVSELGTGAGTITDGLSPTQLTCTTAPNPNPVTTCTGTYNSGQSFTLTASAPAPASVGSSFGGWSPSSNYSACTSQAMTSTCPITMTSNMTGGVFFVPPPTTVTLQFSPTAPVNTAYFNCGVSNPSPANPCPNPNAHQLTLGVPAVTNLEGFSLVVAATEVSPLQADGNCETNNNVANDFDCRFVSFFSGPTVAGGVQTPLCDAYSNGDCVFYSVYYTDNSGARTEPPTSDYTPPVTWTIAFNDDNNTAPAGYSSSERLYDDPDYEPSPTSPYGTNCLSAMVTGTPPGSPTNPAIKCQFEFDITTFFDPNEVVDRGIGGVTQQFNDVVVAFPLSSAAPSPSLSVIDTADPSQAPAVGGVQSLASTGLTIGYTATITNTAAPGAGSANNVVLTDTLPSASGLSWSIASVNPAQAMINGTLTNTCSISTSSPQQLICNFGSISPVVSAIVDVTSPSVSGTFSNSATVTASNNPTVTSSPANITVSSTAFTGLASPSAIAYGTASVALSGVIGSGSLHPPTTESVTVSIDGVTTTAAIGSGGVFSVPAFATSTIPASATPYTITYSYAGDSDFTPATNTATTLTVNQATATFNSVTASQSAPYGTSSIALAGTISAGSLQPPAGEAVKVTIDGISQSTTTTTGGAFSLNFTTSAIPASTTPYTITYSYAGDTNFTTATNTATTLTVNTASGTTFSSVAASQSITYGATSIALSGTLTSGSLHPPAGETVNVTIDAITQSTTTKTGGTFTLAFTTSAIPASATPYTITYNYGGDTNFSSVTNTSTTLTVNQATATFSAVTASQSITVGAASISLSGTLSAGSLHPPAGETVTATIDGIVQSTTTTGTGGTFALTFTTSAIPASTTPYTISYSYAGDTNFTTATNASSTLTVNSASSTTFTAVTASQSITYGTPSIALGGTLTSGAKHPPAGETVKVTIDGITQSTTTTGTGGTFTLTFTTSSIPASATPYTITYSYGGDTNFSSATNTATTLTVNKTTTTFSAVAASQSITAGAASIALSGTLSSGSLHPPAGEPVTVSIDGITQSTTTTGTGGTFTFTFTTSAIPASTTPYTITYSYAGDTNFTTATNTSTTLTVNSASSTTTFSSVTASRSITYGTASIALGGTLTSGTKHPPAGETVKVTIDGITQSTTITGTGGTFTLTFTTSAIPVSTTPYTITYSYGGDSTFGPATNTATTLTVNKTTTTFSAVTASQSITVGAPSISLSGTLSSGSLHPPAGETVTVTIDSLTQSTTTTGTGGTFTLTFTTSAIPASATPYTISYSYAGDTNFTTATNTSTTLAVNSAGGTGLTISPTSLAFGNVYYGTVPVKMVTLTNNTASTVTISSVSLTAVPGGDSYDFVGLNLCSKTLAVKKSCQIEMSFIPNSQVNIVQSAILTIVDSASKTAQTVTMTATVIDPLATPSPSSLNFGTVKTGTTSATKTVTVTNTGLTTTTISAVAISGNFALTTASTCKATTTLTAGGKCTLVVTFTPTAKGSHTGQITLTDNALNSPQAISLSGTGD
jgi:YVTN family beta-propeller protein